MNKITNKTAIKKAFAALMALIIALSLAACGSDGGKEKTESTESKLSVVCSIFPVYDFARTISGGKADVRLLLPPGMDSHDFEPSVGDMVLCDSADLFIYTDSEMEVWADGLSKGFTHAKAVRCADGIDLEALNEDWEAIENEHEEAHDEHEHKYDAHIWLDPTLAVVMCQNIEKALSAADPANAAFYAENLASLTEALTRLDGEFEQLFKRHPDGVLCFGGEFAYSHFIRRYGAKYLSAYDSCGENEEVNLGTLITMVERMKADGIKYIFTDEHSSGLISKEISDETGAEVVVFHTLHSVSSDELGLGYIDIMTGNYNVIAKVLGEE